MNESDMSHNDRFFRKKRGEWFFQVPKFFPSLETSHQNNFQVIFFLKHIALNLGQSQRYLIIIIFPHLIKVEQSIMPVQFVDYFATCDKLEPKYIPTQTFGAQKIWALYSPKPTKSPKSCGRKRNINNNQCPLQKECHLV